MESNAAGWSTYFQNPEMMERSRMFLIAPEMQPLVRQWCGVRDGMRILDVGCGTGYFTRILSRGGNVTAAGIDTDEAFISYAQKTAAEQGLDIDFETADAAELPFPDDSFDLVASHTFLTVVSDPERSFSEMKRVLRPGGIIASVTPMGYIPSAMSLGNWPEDCTWHKEFETAFNRFYRIYSRLDPVSRYKAGLTPGDVPRFFAEQGLEQISAYPLGKLFSLSNAAISDEEKLRYLELYESSETKKLDAFMQLEEMRSLVTDEEAEHYRDLIRQKCGWHRSHLSENEIWEWQGGCNLLVTGRLEQ